MVTPPDSKLWARSQRGGITWPIPFSDVSMSNSPPPHPPSPHRPPSYPPPPPPHHQQSAWIYTETNRHPSSSSINIAIGALRWTIRLTVGNELTGKFRLNLGLGWWGVKQPAPDVTMTGAAYPLLPSHWWPWCVNDWSRLPAPPLPLVALMCKWLEPLTRSSPPIGGPDV